MNSGVPDAEALSSGATSPAKATGPFLVWLPAGPVINTAVPLKGR